MQKKITYLNKLKKLTNRSFFDKLGNVIQTFSKRRLVRRLQKENDIKYTTTQLFTGNTFHIALPDNVSRITYFHGWFEGEDTKAVLMLLNENDTFIDIGAHIGYYSVIASEIIGSQGKIISFEPTPSTFELLSKNLKDCKNVTLENKAVFSEDKTLVFNDFGMKYMVFNSFKTPRLENIELEPKKIDVQAVRLDTYIPENNLKPSLIKIDAESVELEILKGAVSMLKTHQPILCIEIGDFEGIDSQSSRKIIDFLMNLDYQVFEFTNNRFVRHTPKDESYSVMNLYFATRNLEEVK